MLKPSINVTIPKEAKDKLELMAETRNQQTKNRVYPADIVREAIQEYFDKRNIDIHVTVDRGGYRLGEDK